MALTILRYFLFAVFRIMFCLYCGLIIYAAYLGFNDIHTTTFGRFCLVIWGIIVVACIILVMGA